MLENVHAKILFNFQNLFEKNQIEVVAFDEFNLIVQKFLIRPEFRKIWSSIILGKTSCTLLGMKEVSRRSEFFF